MNVAIDQYKLFEKRKTTIVGPLTTTTAAKKRIAT